ncbi:MAG: dienelactone hydrolase family protein [Deltaproteobacteria bacterium]|jgi:predicted dienelactone hydrolase|nr:dienelactone hydrolase family protein [Deltaproteobacteria bacterium]
MPYRPLAASLLLLGALLAGSPSPVLATGNGPNLPQAGFRSVGLWKPEIPIRMDIAVWYPSLRAPRDLTIEGWSFRAGKDGAGSPGRYPVILLSHDAASSRFASHDLASHLARHGFVVIAPTHPGDNINDTGAFFHAANFAERPKHLLLALEAATQTREIAPLLDAGRVGILGVGSGAATALQIAGAAPDLARLETYCPPPDDAGPSLDPLCSQWARGFHPRMLREFALLAAGGPESFTPFIERPSQPSSGDAAADKAAERPPASPEPDAPQEQDAPQDLPGQIAPPDLVGPSPREQALARAERAAAAAAAVKKEKQPILAVGLLTPGFIDLFSDASLQSIAAPVGIFAALHDGAYPSEKTVGRLQALLPQRPASRTVQDATHGDLQAPCPPMHQDNFEALCGSRTPSANDMRKIRNDFFVRFFQKFLGPPAPPSVR